MGDIFVMRPDGTGLSKLTDGSSRNCLSSWSSDGHIFFASDLRHPGGNTDLWAMNADGSGPTPLTPFPGEKNDGVFFPLRGA